MAELPETRASLMLRLKDLRDDAAWAEFLELYHPAVYRLARSRGLQPADAEDLAQRVFLSVAQSMPQWDPAPDRGRFRAWLMRTTRNAILNAMTRGRPDQAAGGTTAWAICQLQVADDAALDAEWETEHRRQVFRWAMRQVRQEVHPDTWEAFWLTTVQGETVDSVAARLGKSVGAVYAARCRLMRRLKEKVRQYQAQLD